MAEVRQHQVEAVILIIREVALVTVVLSTSLAVRALS
jgi:hypothetical protein